MFAAWGRTQEEAEQVLARARETGSVLPVDTAYPLVWSDPDPVPRSWWVAFGRDSQHDLADRELEAMHKTVEVIEIAEEREAPLATGEDITGVDDIDFLIRAIHQVRAKAAVNLPALYIRATPYPEVHYQPCACSRCASSETHPMEAHRRHDAQAKAWLARYLPAGRLH